MKPNLATRVAVALIVVLPLLAVYEIVRQNQERSARIAAVADKQRQLDVQQKQLDRQQRQLQRFKINLIVSACRTENERAKQAIATEYRKDLSQMAQLLPAPRSRREQAIVNTFVSAGVRGVKEANPYRDCSAKALGIKPLRSPKAPTPGGALPPTDGHGAAPPTLPTTRAPPRQAAVKTTTTIATAPCGHKRCHPKG